MLFIDLPFHPSNFFFFIGHFIIHPHTNVIYLSADFFAKLLLQEKKYCNSIGAD